MATKQEIGKMLTNAGGKRRSAILHAAWAIGACLLSWSRDNDGNTRSPYKNSSIVRHLVSFIRVDITHSWAKPVFSPVSGVVTASSDGVPDRMRLNMLYDLVSLFRNRPDLRDGICPFGGNHVIIACETFYMLLAHLRCGSVAVNIGEQVSAGQTLGEVGNSGSSLQPYLHLQVMSSENPFPLFKNLLPLRLARGKRKTDNKWKEETDMALKNGDHLLFDE